MRARLTAGIAIVLAGLLVQSSGGQAGPQPPIAVERLGTLKRDGPLSEISGVAASRAHAGVFWVHNDSGDDPVVYAVASSGALIAAFEATGARVTDWEDIALGDCPDNVAATCIFIGDLGDNAEQRSHGVIYIIPEPDPHAVDSGGRGALAARGVRVRYEGGSHDVEALAVDPSGNVHLVTKGRSGGILRYRLRRDELLEDSVSVAPVEQLPISPAPLLGRWVTGAAMSPDGRRVVVRTYTELYFFERRDGDAWSLAGPACWLGIMEPQGEAVDFFTADRVILLSESFGGLDGTILAVKCP